MIENKAGSHNIIPDSKVQGANMRPIRVLSTPDGPHVGPMNLAIQDVHVIASLYHYIQWNMKTIRSIHTVDE